MCWSVCKYGRFQSKREIQYAQLQAIRPFVWRGLAFKEQMNTLRRPETETVYFKSSPYR